MSLELDLTSKRTKNLKVLKSINENVFEIVEDSSHVALYRYDTILSKWMKLDVEGTAFITRNKEAPFYSLIVMNKKGPTDFVLDLDASLKVKVQDVYIMMKCSTNNVSFVFGLWFHHVDERTSIFQAMKRITSNTNGNSPTGLNSTLSSLLQNSSQKGKSPPASARESESDENVQKLSFSDILKGKSREISPVHSKPPADSGVSKGSMSGCESSRASKKNLLLSALRPSTDNLANSPVPSFVASATTPEAAISSGSSDTPSGANRLLSLLKASGRDPATAAVTSGSSSGSTGSTPSSETKNRANGNTSQSNNHPANPSAKKPSNLLPSPVPSGSQSGKNVSSPPVPEDERSVKLLSMLRVATTSDQAMDLLTDGDIANKVNKSHSTAATSSSTTSTSAAPASTASLSTLQSAVSAASPGILGSSSDRLLSLLKTNSSSTVNGSGSSNASMAKDQQQVSNHQQMTRAHTVGSMSNSASVSAKEDKLRSMLSMSPTIPTLNANTASERRSLTPSTTLTSTSSTTTSSGSSSSNSNGAMRRAYTLSPTIKPLSHSTVISTAQRDSVYLKSPELKGMSAPAQPLSISTSNNSNSNTSSSSVKLVKPMLLSPSDLAKLVV